MIGNEQKNPCRRIQLKRQVSIKSKITTEEELRFFCLSNKMKNLPNIFPIRYALIVSPDEDTDCPANNINCLFHVFKEREVVFRQLLLRLQKQPLTKDMLSMSKMSVGFKLSGFEAIRVTKLEATSEWKESVETKMQQILPELVVGNYSFGNAFNLGLFSYKGNIEIPAFIRAYNESKKNKVGRNFAGLSKSATSFFQKTYTKVSEGKIKEWELYGALGYYQAPIYVTSYYSALWEMLDSKELTGIIEPSFFYHFKNKEIKKLVEGKHYKEKISIAVCSNWESLFAEEIRALYKMFRFCNNCGKPLPFGTKYKNCPRSPVNIECNRSCDRIRAKKTRSLAKNITKKKNKL